MNELLRLHEVWKQRGDTFSAVFTDDSTLFDVLKKILAVGFSEPTLNYGQIVPVRNEPRTKFNHVYTPDIMKGKGLERNARLFDEQEPDGIEVEYFSTETWKPETVMCLLPGDLGAKPEKLRAFGVTDKKKAWQYGMRARRRKRYSRVTYSFTTEMDGLNSNYLDYNALVDDVPGYGQSGRVEDYSYENGVTTIYADAALEWGEGSHHVILRKPDGTAAGPFVCRVGDDAYSLKITGSIGFTPDLTGAIEPPIWLFGPADRYCYPALITDIEPRGTESCNIKARKYDVREYADDDNEPDANGYPKAS